jgi:hypothetical protein
MKVPVDPKNLFCDSRYGAAGYNNRVNVYSNPSLKVNGATAGTTTANNAALLNLNRFAMAAVGNEALAC